MDAIFEHWEFVLLLLFGGAVVGVHANSLFSQRVATPTGDNRSDPLAALSLPVILGQSDYRRGFYIYLLASELLYIVLASSSTVLGLTLEVLGQQNSVGALSENLAPNLLYPIVASSVVVLMTQTRPTSGIEQTFRRMAHSIAGVQRNLDEVKAKIHRIVLSSSVRDELVRSARERAQALSNATPSEHVTEFERENFKASLTRVHCLYYWTIGYNSQSIWFSEHSQQIKSLFDSLHLEYGNLNNEANAIQRIPVSNGASLIADSERWRVLIRATHQLEHRLTTVLSLLLINQPDADFDQAPALHELREVVLKKRAGDHPNVTSLVGQTILYAAPIMLLLATVHSSATHLWRRITAERLSDLPDFPRTVNLSVLDRLQALPAEYVEITDKLIYLSDKISTAMILSIDYALIFVISAGVALFARKTQIELRRWNAHDADGIPGLYPPVVRYLYLGLLGYLLSTAVFLVWKFLVHNFIEPLRSGIEVQVELTMRTFGEFLPDYLLESLTAFVCVWFVLQYADRGRAKDGKFASTALLFGIGCMAVIVLQNTIRADFPRSTAMASYVLGPLCGYVTLFVAFARVFKKHTVVETIPLSKRSLLLRKWTLMFTRKKAENNTQSSDPLTEYGKSQRQSAEASGSVSS